MNNNNPRPLGVRKTVQLLVILTLLAWATQTLFHQWGYGAIIFPASTTDEQAVSKTANAAAPTIFESSEPSSILHVSPPPLAPVSPSPVSPPPAAPAADANGPITLELRSQIKVAGTRVTLRDVCRWSPRDQVAVEPIADTVLRHLADAGGAARTVSVAEVRAALHDAGVNVANVRFSGAAACAIAGGDVSNPGDSAKTQAGGDAASAPDAADAPAAVTSVPTPRAPQPIIADAPQTPLKDLLLADLHERLKLSGQQVQVDFDPKDSALLALTTPRNRFDFDGDRTANALGSVSWSVVIQTDAGDRRATVTATARAWEDQLVLTRPLSRGQAILKGDLAPRRVLVDKPTTNPSTTSNDVVGQLASRELKRGDVLTAADTTAPQLVRSGDFVTVTLKVGDNLVQTVATALDGGTRGATIRARNQASDEIYHVRITAADTGDVIAATSDGVASTDSDNINN